MISVYNISEEGPIQMGPSFKESETKMHEQALQSQLHHWNQTPRELVWLVYNNK